MYGGLKKFHEFLEKDRDVDGNGLLLMLHPDENGMDDSPMWDAILKRLISGGDASAGGGMGISDTARKMAVLKMRTEPPSMDGQRPDALFFAKTMR